MTPDQFVLILSAMALAFALALWMFAYSLAGSRGRLVLVGGLPLLPGYLRSLAHRGRHAGRRRDFRDEHVGVTEETMLLTVEYREEFKPDPPVLHQEPQRFDPEELRILAELDELVAAWRTAPDYVLEFQEQVDAVAKWYGIDNEAHRRWRMTAWDWHTGSYPVLDAELVPA